MNITIIIVFIIRKTYIYIKLMTHFIHLTVSTTLEVHSMIIVEGANAVHQVFARDA